MQNNLKNSLSLRQLQKTFGEAITTYHSLPSEDLDWVGPQAPIQSSKRLEIYQTSWWLRLFESIADDYKAVFRCLEEKEFNRVIRAYLKACPPGSYTLVHAGDRLPEFLESFENYSETRPWIGDLARLQRADYQVYYATDCLKWDPSQLSQLSPAEIQSLRLRIQPSVFILKSKWKIRGLLKKGTTCPPGVSYSLVYRNGYDSTHKTLKPLQFKLLDLARNGATLNDWAECAKESTHWVEWLGEWAAQGIIYPEKFNES